jgi:site-specific DNA-methyltransferase (adenine-specific)
LIRTYANEGEVVLDNACGSGTTAIACLNTNRKYILIEKMEKYHEIAKKRIEEYENNGKILYNSFEESF